MHKIEIINDKKAIKLNYENSYYYTKYDWPLDTIFNLNGSLNKEINKKYSEGQVYMEIFTETSNAKTYDASYGNDFEECEEKLWNKYQSYLHCNHEYIRESPKGIHYSDGTGFCKHCGMMKINALKPESICEKCGKPATLIQLVDGKNVCEECNDKESWNNVLNCHYFTDFTFQEYLISKHCVLESYKMYEKDNILNLIYTIIKNDGRKCELEWTMQKEDEGVYKVISYKYLGFFALSKILFGPTTFGRNYYLTTEGVNKLIQKKNMVEENLIKNIFNESTKMMLEIEEFKNMEHVIK